MAEEKTVAAEATEEKAEKKPAAKKPAAKKPAAKKPAAQETAEKAAPKKEAAEKKAPAKRAPAKKKAPETVTIKLAKSLIGRGEKQIATAKALGLKKPGDTTTQPDNAATRGKISKLSHLVEVVKA